MIPAPVAGGPVVALDAGDRVKVKKRCCKKARRCTKCPARWKALANLGLVLRVDKRRYVALRKLGKHWLKRKVAA